MARRTHSETITITLARKQKLTTESNVSEAIQQPSSVKYEQKSDAGRDIKHNLEETTECRQWNVRDGMHKQLEGIHRTLTPRRALDVVHEVGA